MNNNGEYFDGNAVTSYESKFAGTFDLPEEVGSVMRFNDVVMFLVTANVGESKVSATKNGDLKRSNRLDIIAIRDIDPKAATLIENALTASGAPQGTFVV